MGNLVGSVCLVSCANMHPWNCLFMASKLVYWLSKLAQGRLGERNNGSQVQIMVVALSVIGSGVHFVIQADSWSIYGIMTC